MDGVQGVGTVPAIALRNLLLLPCRPVTNASATEPDKYGHSPKVSSFRPQRGCLMIFTTGDLVDEIQVHTSAQSVNSKSKEVKHCMDLEHCLHWLHLEPTHQQDIPWWYL
jgi:hypothetical protein